MRAWAWIASVAIAVALAGCGSPGPSSGGAGVSPSQAATGAVPESSATPRPSASASPSPAATKTAASPTPGRSASSSSRPSSQVRYDLPNLGVAVTMPGDLLVRTALVDTLGDVQPDPDVDIANLVGQLRLSPLLVSAAAGIGFVGYSPDGSTMVTVAATQVSDLKYDLAVPAGRAYMHKDDSPDTPPNRSTGYVELPADDVMLGIRATSSRLPAGELDAFVLRALQGVEILGAPATTKAGTKLSGPGAEIDPVFDAWIPDRLADLPVLVTGIRGRFALAHPMFDGRSPAPLALLCGQLATNADEVMYVVAIAGGTDRTGPVELRGCRVRGATSDAWLRLLAPELERLDAPLPVFRVPGSSPPMRVVVAGQVLLLLTTTTDALADATVKDLPTVEIPADAAF